MDQGRSHPKNACGLLRGMRNALLILAPFYAVLGVAIWLAVR